MNNNAFTKTQRLLSSSDFQPVFDDAPFRASHKNFLILSRPSTTTSARLGLVIAKKNIRTAVARNRIKRFVREVFRHSDLPPIDIVFLARRGLDLLDNDDLHRQIEQQLKRISKKAKKTLEAANKNEAASCEHSNK